MCVINNDVLIFDLEISGGCGYVISSCFVSEVNEHVVVLCCW